MRNNKHKIKVTKDFLIEYYINKKLTVKQLSELTGYCKSSIRTFLINFGIEKNIQGNDLTGQIFYNIKINKLHHIGKMANAYWECECLDCKNKIILSSTDLKYRKFKNCGCKEIIFIQDTTCGKHFLLTKYSATKKNLEINITPHFMWNLYLKQDKKCALSGVDIYVDQFDTTKSTASLDRIDSNIGYLIGNCQWVLRDINKMKLDFSMKYFFNLVKTIKESNQEEEEKPFEFILV